MANEEILKKSVFSALMNVQDPDIGVDIVSLGLVYNVIINKKEVIIIFTLTSPSCPFHDYFVEEIKENLKEIIPNKKINVKITFDPIWTPERIDPDIRAALNL